MYLKGFHTERETVYLKHIRDNKRILFIWFPLPLRWGLYARTEKLTCLILNETY